jgi:hypothetical protein
MPLKDFKVVHDADDKEGAIVHSQDGDQLIIASVTRGFVKDATDAPNRPQVVECNAFVERNLGDFARAISSKYERGDFQVMTRHGQRYPLVVIGVGMRYPFE